MFFPKSHSLPVMGDTVRIDHNPEPYTWDSDGRYEWLKGKADRLETEANNATQGSLGQ
jgi:hypothetical protein